MYFASRVLAGVALDDRSMRGTQYYCDSRVACNNEIAMSFIRTYTIYTASGKMAVLLCTHLLDVYTGMLWSAESTNRAL